jgi:hypothetical protein
VLGANDIYPPGALNIPRELCPGPAELHPTSCAPTVSPQALQAEEVAL